jgi:hypothetical protein
MSSTFAITTEPSASTQHRIIDTFLEKLSASPEFDADQLTQLQNLLRSDRPDRTDDLLQILAPAGAAPQC